MAPSRTIATETDGAPVFASHWRRVVSTARSSVGDSGFAWTPNDAAIAAATKNTRTVALIADFCASMAVCCTVPRKTKRAPHGRPLCKFDRPELSRCHFHRIAQHIATAPDGLNVIVAIGCGREFFAQLADEDVDDLELGLVHAAIEMIEEHLLGERRALPQREQLEHLIFFAGQVNAAAIDFDC